MDSAELKAFYGDLPSGEKEAFKMGALRDLYTSETDSVIKNLENSNIEKKFVAVFDRKALNKTKNLLAREDEYNVLENMAKAQRGAGAHDSVANTITGGVSEGLPGIGHRRAYSLTGLQFAGADAILEALQTNKLPTSVKQEVIKKLRSSKSLDEAISKMYKSKTLRDNAALKGVLAKTRRVGTGQLAAGSLLNSVMGEQAKDK
jgi:hypothetical protein